MKKSLAGFTTLLLTLIAVVMYYTWTPSDRVYEPDTGRKIYARNCAGCHGSNGKGNGSAAEYLFPKPRNFTSGVYKFTSTPNGKLPTDEDLERVVAQGLSPGGMPGFNDALSKQQIAKVVDYIKTFSDKFGKQKIPESVSVSEPPETLLTQTRIKKGRNLYEKLGCQSCHGPKGKGNGPTADQQKDHWGDPIPPRDLTRGNYKSGNDPKSIYRRIVTGITGTGMPPYGSVLQSEDERWAMVAYVKSLSQESNYTQPTQGSSDGLIVKQTNVSNNKLKDPNAPIWSTAERIRMPLYSLWVTDRTPFDSVEVRALHNGKQLAIRMNWNDPTKNMKPIDVTEDDDGAAVMFPDLKGAVPFLGMGDATMRGGMAHVWHWRASDQFAVNRGGATHDLEDRYPNMQASYYPGKEDHRPGKRAEFTNQQQHTKNQPEMFQSAWAADNTLSEPTIKSPVRSYRARGFGTLTALPDNKMQTDGSGVYGKDGWSIVMTRGMQTETDVVQFKPGDQRSAAFAVWDGEQHDRNGQKDITSWITLKLEDKNNKKRTN